MDGSTTSPALPGSLPSLKALQNRKVPLAHRWHRTLDGAIKEARATGKPILQLWLLGALDEELSCANSRFFRQTLYPDARVHRALADAFVLCWQSFRPVPVVTIDFGDGRRLVRTLTGNSVHLICDAHGRPVDALPGVYRPRAFVTGIAWAARLAQQVRALEEPERRRVLAAAHAAARPLPTAAARAQDPSRPSAREAGAIAQTKMRVEAPLLDGTRDLFESLAEDERRNETELHPRIHAHFVDGAVDDNATRFAHFIYRELFLMPPEDAWLGLRAGDSALWNDGVVAGG